jgi:uncharacterized protein YdaU (DUF1376 family)
MLMTPQEEGAYIRLLAICWTNDGLPDDDEQLAMLSRLGNNWNTCSTHVRACFFSKNGKLFNKRLIAEKKKQDDFQEKRRLAGIESGKVRRGKSLSAEHMLNTTRTNDEQKRTLPLPSSSSSTSSENNTPLPPKGEQTRNNKPPFPTKEWDEICTTFPPGQRIDELAKRNFKSLLSTYTPEQLLTAVKNYQQDFRSKGGEYPYKLSNFFGRAAYFKSYLPENFNPEKERSRRLQESGLPPEYIMNAEGKLERV